MNNAVSEKLWKMLENIQTLNLSQQKKKKLFGVRTKLSYYKVLHRNFFCNRNEKKRDNYEWSCQLRTLNTRIK